MVDPSLGSHVQRQIFHHYLKSSVFACGAVGLSWAHFPYFFPVWRAKCRPSFNGKILVRPTESKTNKVANARQQMSQFRVEFNIVSFSQAVLHSSDQQGFHKRILLVQRQIELLPVYVFKWLALFGNAL